METDLGRLGDALRQRLAQQGDGTLQTARRVRRAVSRELRGEPGARVVALSLHALSRGALPRWFLYELIRDHPDALSAVDARSVRRLAGTLASWGDVDAFGCLLAGQAWRRGAISDAEVLRWTQMRDALWRRAALVSTVPLNNKTQGGQGDPARTLMVCDALLRDRDDLVVKALSWALRELAARDRDAVADYVQHHRDALAARVLREVRNKLATGVKNGRGARRGGRRRRAER